MNIAIFSTKPYDRRFFDAAASDTKHQWTYLETRLGPESSKLAEGFDVVYVFVNDQLDKYVMSDLASRGVKLVTLRCAGYNNVDLRAAAECGITIARVPAYSPHAVAEHTLALLLTLNRQIHRAYNRVREGNFAIDGLLGFDMFGKTASVVGTGRIGELVCKLLIGFGCRVIAHDLQHNSSCLKMGVEYLPLDEVTSSADILSLHCPLTPNTRHLIDDETIESMKPGVVLINTSRGGLVDSRAVIRGLKSRKIGGLALDVYEEEADIFFENLSNEVLQDDTLARLLTFPNVLITSHQAFSHAKLWSGLQQSLYRTSPTSSKTSWRKRIGCVQLTAKTLVVAETYYLNSHVACAVCSNNIVETYAELGQLMIELAKWQPAANLCLANWSRGQGSRSQQQTSSL